MYSEEFNKVINAAKAKLGFLEKNFLGFFISSVLAGAFVGLGILLAFTSAGLVTGQPYQKIVLGATFGIALSLVIMAGSELFTGNNFVLSAAAFMKEVTWGKVVKLWTVCFVGNWVGSIIIAVMFVYSGLANGLVLDFFNNVSVAKTTIAFDELIIRAILCNTLVCLAVWSSIKLTSETAKLIMIWWCLLAFMVIGLEHSIANMTVLSVSLFSPDGAIEASGYLYNIFSATLGNIIGGVGFVALPYFIIAKTRGK